MTYLARRLDAIFAGLRWREETIVLRAGVLLEAWAVIGQIERVGHLGQEVLLGETETGQEKPLNQNALHFKDDATYAIWILPFDPTGMLLRCWTQRSTATESPICTMAVPSLVFKNFI